MYQKARSNFHSSALWKVQGRYSTLPLRATCRRVRGIASLRHISKVRGQLQATGALIPEPTEYEAGLAPQPLWTFRRAYKPLTVQGSQSTGQFLYRLNYTHRPHWAIGRLAQ